jgi:hypothetical protein
MIRMPEVFPGCRAVVVPDNLRSGSVTQACRDEPAINRSYLVFARHYGLAVVPAVSLTQGPAGCLPSPADRPGAAVRPSPSPCPRPPGPCRADPSRLIAWAAKTEPATAQVVSDILAARPHPEQDYRACLGRLRLGKRYGPERLGRPVCGLPSWAPSRYLGHRRFAVRFARDLFAPRDHPASIVHDSRMGLASRARSSA